MPRTHINRNNIATLSAGRILRIGKDFSCAFIAFALILVVFFYSFTWFRGMRQDVLAAGPLLFLLCLPAGLLLGLASSSKHMCRLVKAIESKYAFFLLGFGTLLFIAQLAIANGSWFLTDWDAEALVHGAVYGIQDNFDYFSTYPNQLLLTSLFEVVSRFTSGATYESVYFELVIGSCLCLSFSVVIITFVARKLGGTKVSLLTLFLSTALFGLSPWMLVPYSDTYGMIAPVTSLFVFAYVRNRPLRLAGVTFFSILGYFIKPTSIFVLCSVLLVEACSLFKKAARCRTKGSRISLIRQATASLLAIAIAAFAAMGINTALTSHYDVDKNRSFSLEHYLMLGANSESNGRWTAEDFELSASIEDPTIRKQRDVSEWINRIEDMGVGGIVKLAAKKTLNNYLDGTFWWEGEGKFYIEVVGDNKTVRDFYNIGHEKNWIAGSAENETPFFIIEQGIWIFVLVGSCLGALNRNPNNGITVAYLTILAISLFLMVFECRARYLFLFAPFFTLIGAQGWQTVIRLFNARRCTEIDTPLT